MKVVLFLSIVFLPFPVLAVTLLETTATMGVASTLNNQARPNSKAILNKARNTVNQYNKRATQFEQMNVERRGIDHERGPKTGRADNRIDFPERLNLQNEQKGTGGSNEHNDREIAMEGAGDSTLANYDAKIAVFYKQDCRSKEPGCQRSGPVLTNIKSVIFDYNHGRLNPKNKLDF